MRCDPNIWELVHRGGPIDATQFLRALVRAGDAARLDTRGRILHRDAIDALRQHWGHDALSRRLRMLNAAFGAESECQIPDEGRFSTIRERLVDATNPQNLLAMLRELGTRIATPVSLTIGGSLALMLDALLTRVTDDANLVDEIPASLRKEHDLLRELAQRYGLRLTHFQSHFLPEVWQTRCRSLGRFGVIDAFVVDSIDILAGKLFSHRTKDLDDVRAAWPIVDQARFRDRLSKSTASLRSEPDLLAAAERNWNIVTGDSNLPATNI